jgi:GNAT superfamily N-acetyltransferase
MQTSVRSLFPLVYSLDQTASALIHVARLDPVLIADGTYFVHQIPPGQVGEGEIVACGGWSRRAKLYSGSGARDDDQRLLDPATEPARIRAMFVRSDWTRRGLGRAVLNACHDAADREGFRELILMATLPGIPLYASFGFVQLEQVQIPMPDGLSLAGALMTRQVVPQAVRTPVSGRAFGPGPATRTRVPGSSQPAVNDRPHSAQ